MDNIDKKKKTSPLTITLLLFFIIFISLYFTQITDLYEYGQYNKMSMTKEAMKKFESDIANGKNIEIEKYIDNKAIDYSNGASKLGNKTSNFIEKLMTKGLKETYRIFNVLFSG